MNPWSKGHSGTRRCISCEGLADCKPVDGCREPRHYSRWEGKSKRNNAYRRERRTSARLLGTVDRTGRGSTQNKADYSRRKHIEIRRSIFSRLKQWECVKCGFSDERALQFDHWDGGGRKHRKSLPSGSAYYRALKTMKDSELITIFQVLCANCNAIKRYEKESRGWTNASSYPEKKS